MMSWDVPASLNMTVTTRLSFSLGNAVALRFEANYTFWQFKILDELLEFVNVIRTII